MPLKANGILTLSTPFFFFPKPTPPFFFPNHNPSQTSLEVYDISFSFPVIFFFPKPQTNTKPKLSIKHI